MNCMLGDDEYTLIRKNLVVVFAVWFLIGWLIALACLTGLYMEKQAFATALADSQKSSITAYNEGIDVGVAIAETAAKQNRKPCMTAEFIRGNCYKAP